MRTARERASMNTKKREDLARTRHAPLSTLQLSPTRAARGGRGSVASESVSDDSEDEMGPRRLRRFEKQSERQWKRLYAHNRELSAKKNRMGCPRYPEGRRSPLCFGRNEFHAPPPT